jgi:hypothetical protein
MIAAIFEIEPRAGRRIGVADDGHEVGHDASA